MKIEELTPELMEKAKRCETREERMAFIEENDIELSDEQLESIAGGVKIQITVDHCSGSDDGRHKWERTGRTRPATWFRDLWPDKEERCTNCGKERWVKY